MRNNLKKSKGQTLYYFLVFSMILFISWAMMLNIAKLIRDRMIMQNLADNTALSIATHKARVMNFVAGCNYWIGTLLAMGTQPDIIQFPSYRTDAVASVVFGDVDRFASGVKPKDNDVKKLAETVKILQDAQENAMLSHMTYSTLLRAEVMLKGYAVSGLLDEITFSIEDAEKHFGLKRNRKGITYLKTINFKSSALPHIVFNPFPMESMLKIIESIAPIYSKSAVEEAKSLISGIDSVTEVVSSQSDYSWYITDRNFHKQKIKVDLIKITNENDSPLLKKWLKLDSPFNSMKKAFSAAAIYNTKGTMFPKTESEFTGFPPKFINYMTEGIIFTAMMTKIGEFFSKNLVLGVAASIYLPSVLAASLYTGNIGNNINISPIKSYEESKLGGWAAHLVPYRSQSENDDREED